MTPAGRHREGAKLTSWPTMSRFPTSDAAVLASQERQNCVGFVFALAETLLVASKRLPSLRLLIGLLIVVGDVDAEALELLVLVDDG